MKATKKIILLGCFLMVNGILYAQFIDNFGIRLGGGLSYQNWHYKPDNLSNSTHEESCKIGFIGQVFAEKYFGSRLSLKPAIGYVQKGCVQDLTLVFNEPENLEVKDNRVVLHDISIDLSLKIIPFERKIKPYIILGLRGDYLMDYRSVIVELNGDEYETSTNIFDDFQKATLGGIIGLGVSFKELLSVDIEFNPAFMKNFDSQFLEINDRYFNATIGLNIKRLLNAKSE